MSNLISRLTKLKARLDKIPARLGSPLYRDLVFRMREQITLPNGLITETNTDLLITPKPKVVNLVNKQSDDYGNGIYVSTSDYSNSDDYKVTVPRVIDIADLEHINYLILDPILDEDNRVVGGIKCSLIYISDRKTLDWELIIQRVVDNYTIEPLNSLEIPNE